MIKSIGIRHTFQTFSFGTLITGLLYVGFYHLYMKHRPSVGTDITKKDVEKDKTETNDKTNNIPNDLPVNYEDGLYNTGFQNTENEDDVQENDMETRNNINKIHLQANQESK